MNESKKRHTFIDLRAKKEMEDIFENKSAPGKAMTQPAMSP